MKHSLILLMLAAAGVAQAHITLDQPAAPAGSSYRATFKVGHGCNGKPTQAIVVTLPAGLRGAKPMPKPGWTLTTTRRPLEAPYESHGKPVTDELAEVRWVAATPADVLPDDWYDEFVLRAGLPAEPGELWFAVRQVCTEGEWNWAERPSAANPRPKAPAVRLQVQPAALPPAAPASQPAHTH